MESGQTMEEVFKAAVKRLKDLSETRGIIALPLLEDDPLLLMLFILWPKFPPQLSWTEDQPGIIPALNQGRNCETEEELDCWTWEQAEVQEKELKKALNLESIDTVRATVEKGRLLCLLYADGSVNHQVLALLVSRMTGRV